MLGKAIAGQLTEASVEKSDDFLDFDSTENEENDDQVFVNDDKIAVIVNDKNPPVDLLKQIFDKEFIHENMPLIKKPPRKSLENLNHKKAADGSYSSFNSLPYD